VLDEPTSLDEETVVRPRVERGTAPRPTGTDDLGSGIDADTIIRARGPHAAAPTLPALVEPEPPTGSVSDVLDPAPVESPRERVFAYGFRVNNGRAVSLETPVLIGRAPTPPRILTAEPPLLARVESPHKEVSGTHLELRQQGTLVIATDLRSTNGTTVTPPGRDTQKLRQGESVVVQPGTVIDIGDGNLVEILPLQSRESN